MSYCLRSPPGSQAGSQSQPDLIRDSEGVSSFYPMLPPIFSAVRASTQEKMSTWRCKGREIHLTNSQRPSGHFTDSSRHSHPLWEACLGTPEKGLVAELAVQVMPMQARRIKASASISLRISLRISASLRHFPGALPHVHPGGQLPRLLRVVPVKPFLSLFCADRRAYYGALCGCHWTGRGGSG